MPDGIYRELGDAKTVQTCCVFTLHGDLYSFICISNPVGSLTHVVSLIRRLHVLD